MRIFKSNWRVFEEPWQGRQALSAVAVCRLSRAHCYAMSYRGPRASRLPPATLCPPTPGLGSRSDSGHRLSPAIETSVNSWLVWFLLQARMRSPETNRASSVSDFTAFCSVSDPCFRNQDSAHDGGFAVSQTGYSRGIQILGSDTFSRETGEFDSLRYRNKGKSCTRSALIHGTRKPHQALAYNRCRPAAIWAVNELGA
jgi:hypothetical protein